MRSAAWGPLGIPASFTPYRKHPSFLLQFHIGAAHTLSMLDAVVPNSRSYTITSNCTSTALPNNPMSAPEAPYVSIPDAAYSRVLLLKPTARIVFR